jgi:hypothetical protein
MLGVAVAVLATSTAGVECNSSTLKATSNAIRYYAHTRPPSSTLYDVGLLVSDSIEGSVTVRETLERIAASDEPYGNALATAICTGMEQLTTDNQTTSDEDWNSFLVTEVETLLPNSLPALIDTKVDQFTTAANLAQVNPQLARTYYQQCIASRR